MHDYSREEQRALRACERRVRDIHEDDAVAGAVRICDEHGIEYPAWLQSELLKLGRAAALGMTPKKKQRRPKNVLRNFLWHRLVEGYRDQGLHGEALWTAVVAQLEIKVPPYLQAAVLPRSARDPDLRIKHKRQAKNEDVQASIQDTVKMGLREHRKRIKELGRDEEVRLELLVEDWFLAPRK